jgi:hypothetical protein
MDGLGEWVVDINVTWKLDNRKSYIPDGMEFVFREATWRVQYYFPTNTPDVISALNGAELQELVWMDAQWDTTWYDTMGHPDTLGHTPPWRLGYVKITKVWGTKI